jgi:uncharacterized protein (UPF0261 family)
MEQKRTVVIVVTLDTKGPAAQFLRDEIAAWGLDTILIDPGILGAPAFPADITRWQIAETVGTSLEALIASGDKQACIASQTEGLCRIVSGLYDEGRLGGIISLGGALGTAISTAAMRVLPVGVPKLMLSSIATGSSQFKPYISTKDICIMHSVTDIMDVNAISQPILSNAANGISGMVIKSSALAQEPDTTIGITQSVMTTPCVMRLKRLLGQQGYQIAPFLTGRSGGPAMEELILAQGLTGVIDLSVHEIIDYLFGGTAGAPDRLESISRCSIPAVVSVGDMDYLQFDSLEKTPPGYHNRPHIVHDEQMTVVQPTATEMEAVARYLAEKLNLALGPTIVVVPSVGFSDVNHPGSTLWFPEGNRAVIRVLEGSLHPEVPLVVVDAHINQPVFADIIAVCMARLLAGEPPPSIAARYQFD